MKKYITILLLVLLIVIATLTFIKFSNKKKSDVWKVDVTEFNIAGRARCVLDNSVSIGNNEKELENGYYDLKLTYESGQVEVNLNKLWCENYDDNYIEDEYLAKICRELVRVIKIDNIDKESEYLFFKYIKENFNNVKQEKTAEDIQIKEYNIHLGSDEGMCKLVIKRS